MNAAKIVAIPIGGMLGGGIIGGAISGSAYKHLPKKERFNKIVAGTSTGALLGLSAGGALSAGMAINSMPKPKPYKFTDPFSYTKQEYKNPFGKQEYKSAFGDGFWNNFHKSYGQKKTEGSDWYKNFRSSSGGSSYKNSYNQSSSAKSMHAEAASMDALLRKAKTKADAQSIFRSAAVKNHPDKGGSSEAMRDINSVWSNFRSTHFDKLAFLFSKIYGGRL